MASNESFRFKIVNTDGNEDSPVGKSVQLWAELLKKKSNGRMKTKVYHQGQLGSIGEVFDHMIKGNVDMILSQPLTSYDKRVGVMSLPYLFSNLEQAADAFEKDGWMTKIVDPLFADIGIKHFGPYPFGFGGVATKGRYARNYEQAQEMNLKVRTIPTFPNPQTVQAMGFHSVPLDWNEVYTSIQTGVVDGDSGNIIYWDYEYFGDQLDYFVHTKHLFSFSSLMMNKDTWDMLDEEDQQIIASAAQEVIAKQFKDAKAEDEMWIEKAQNDGMEYFEPSAEELKSWMEPVREIVWREAEKEFGTQLMQRIRDNAPDSQ
ncbi:C4-dicarboxylate ABC transporter substrate-binding protein [Oceanimonas doudoroffii]|uniref:C4-dicarboxylate ABC transporter substrate-binding protein n=2 Tax=Oceanimonas doudoroffii TaxID=84158 RepID=A0A233RK84_9GAMM|nr:C4-dicarboxylate ABC transporter substrate-binding protein [Oceanimonas doudoroffii]